MLLGGVRSWLLASRFRLRGGGWWSGVEGRSAAVDVTSVVVVVVTVAGPVVWRVSAQAERHARVVGLVAVVVGVAVAVAVAGADMHRRVDVHAGPVHMLGPNHARGQREHQHNQRDAC